MKIQRSAIIVAALWLLTWSWAFCEEIPENYKSKTRVTMGSFGTVSTLCIYDDFTQQDALIKYDAIWESIKQMLDDMDQVLSTSIETSEIAQFNELPSGASMAISPLTAEVFQLAREMYDRTEGYFDPTIFPLVDLWGFSPRFTFGSEVTMAYDRPWQDGTRALPDEKYIDGFLELVDMDGIVLTGDAQSGYFLHKNTPSVTIDGVTYHAQLDLGGIAKGYAADLAAQILEEAGYAYGYFSCGTSSIRLLKNASASAKKEGDAAFNLNVRIPRETMENKEMYASIRVMNQALSSSGDYDNHYIAGGNLCCHIINPFTGYPLNYAQTGEQGGISTVTLLSGSAVEDDALTTALCLMGLEKAVEYINKNLRDHSVAMVLYRADAQTYEIVTNVSKEEFIVVDAMYHIASEIDEQGNLLYIGDLFTY